MQTRRLGRTENQSSVIIFGAAALWSISQDGANAALHQAREAGVNHIDVAPQYGDGEDRVGQWLPPYRDQFFLGCKTLERERGAAWDELHRSLKKLQTEQLDLYQLHAIGTFDELDKALAPGGAIEALQDARERGLTRFLGITGHGIDTPKVHAAALERFDFDTIMFPIHPRLYADPDYRQDAERLLAIAQEKDVGVMIIKSITREPWEDRAQATYNTWYKPHDQQEKIQQGVDFALSLPGVSALPSAGDVRLLPLVLQAGQNVRQLDDAQREDLIEASRHLDPLFTRA